MKKSVSQFALFLLALSTFGANSSISSNFEGEGEIETVSVQTNSVVRKKVVRLNAYPSSSLTRELMEPTSEVGSVIIESEYRTEFPPGGFPRDRRGAFKNSLVGYPSNDNAKNLNLLGKAGITVLLKIDAGSYPSSNYINLLKEHVDLDLTIRVCLTSKSRLERLARIKRKAQVKIVCVTESDFERANKIVEYVRLKKLLPHLALDVEYRREN